MKKVLFVFALTACISVSNVFAYVGAGGCTNTPGSNNGHCSSSTTPAGTNYYCVDVTGTQTKDCVKGKDF